MKVALSPSKSWNKLIQFACCCKFTCPLPCQRYACERCWSCTGSQAHTVSDKDFLHSHPVRHVSRNPKAVDPLTFSDMLIDSDLFTAPGNSANEFAEQIKTTVSLILDKLAPIQTSNRRQSKNITRWLSSEASQAKKGWPLIREEIIWDLG